MIQFVPHLLKSLINQLNSETLDIGHKQEGQLVRDYNCSIFIDDSFKNCCDVKNLIKTLKF